MITRFFLVVGRRRRMVLTVGLALSAGYLVVHRWVPSLGREAFPALATTAAVFLALGVGAAVRPRPTRFVVRPRVPAFSTPSQPALVFLALAFLTLATGMTGNLLRHRGSDPFLTDPLLDLGWAVVALLQVAVAWRDPSVQLRPDGLWQRDITGWRVVPWDAAPTVPALPPPPTANTVPLTYGRPELVRRHGLLLRPDALRTQDIDPRLVTAAIRHYASHPEHRPAIGTWAEHDRLMPLLLASPAAAIADPCR